jgi:hypothetical protein
MGDHGHARRERTTEDPWTVALRVVHDLRRDGIHVHHADERMPHAARHAAARHAAALLEALGVAAVIPDENP